MLIMFPLILTNINLGFFWLYVKHNSGQLESLGSFGHCAHPLQIFHLLIFITWIVHLCKKIICSVCVRLIHLNSANKVEVEVELRAYSCWICCRFYKISKLREGNVIFHGWLVPAFNIFVRLMFTQSQSTMFRALHSMHFITVSFSRKI